LPTPPPRSAAICARLSHPWPTTAARWRSARVCCNWRNLEHAAQTYSSNGGAITSKVSAAVGSVPSAAPPPPLPTASLPPPTHSLPAASLARPLPFPCLACAPLTKSYGASAKSAAQRSSEASAASGASPSAENAADPRSDEAEIVRDSTSPQAHHARAARSTAAAAAH